MQTMALISVETSRAGTALCRPQRGIFCPLDSWSYDSSYLLENMDGLAVTDPVLLLIAIAAIVPGPAALAGPQAGPAIGFLFALLHPGSDAWLAIPMAIACLLPWARPLRVDPHASASHPRLEVHCAQGI